MGKARKPAKRKLRHKTTAPSLSAQEIKFVHLLLGRELHTPRKSITECYLEAGFPAKGSHHSTDVTAHRVLKRRGVREYYRKRQDQLAKRAMVTPEMLIAVAMNVVLADRRKFFNDRGELLLPHEWPDDLEAVVEDYDMDTVSEIEGDVIRNRPFLKKLKTCSRMQALFKLMEATGVVGPNAAPPPAEKTTVVFEGADPGDL